MEGEELVGFEVEELVEDYSDEDSLRELLENFDLVIVLPFLKG